MLGCAFHSHLHPEISKARKFEMDFCSTGRELEINEMVTNVCLRRDFR